MNDLTPLCHSAPRHTCQCGCAKCRQNHTRDVIDQLARESLSVALMHAQDGFAFEVDDAEAARVRPAGRGFRRRKVAMRAWPRTQISTPAGKVGLPEIPPARQVRHVLSMPVRFDEVIMPKGQRKDPKHRVFDDVPRNVGRIYVLTVPSFPQPLYVGEIKPDSQRQSLAERMRQHKQGSPEQCTKVISTRIENGRIVKKKSTSEDCLLREALQGRFDQLEPFYRKAGLSLAQRARLERQIKDGNVYVQYADYRLPKGFDPNDLDARVQLQHSAELFAKNRLRALIRTNSVSFEEEERSEGSNEYRVL